MRALCWHGKGDVRVDTVLDPKNSAPERCGYQGYRLCNLRLRPPSPRRLSADHGKRRYSRT